MTNCDSPRHDSSADTTPPSQHTYADSLAVAVATRVADQKDMSPDELPPLYEAIDPNALTNLFASAHDGDQRARGQVMFAYSDCRVTVQSDKTVAVEPLDQHT